MTRAFCEEKMRLLLEYQRMTQAYSNAVGRMAGQGLREHEYERMSAVTEKAREASIQARANLDRHIAEHGC
jgi:uncharacterized membrane protein